MISEWIAKADRALAAGRLQEAGDYCKQVLAREPKNIPACFLLGVVCVKGGLHEAALPYLEASEEGSGRASLWHSRALRQLGRPEDALTYATRAAERMPHDSSTHHELGLCFVDAELIDKGIACFRRAIEAKPSLATAHLALGKALRATGRNTTAIPCFQRAVDLVPTSLQALENLFLALMDESDADGAVTCARSMLKLQPTEARSHLRLCRALLLGNRPEEAEGEVRKALESGGQDGQFLLAVGTVLQGCGRIEEAESFFKQSIDLLPNQGIAYSALVYNRRMDDNDLPLIDRMRSLLPSLSSSSERSFLHYALGKSLEDVGDYEKAIQHYDDANQIAVGLRFRGRAFDRNLYRQRIDWTRENFGHVRLQHLDITASPSDTPIFVVGMLRSGTTLVEQILSSHPEIGAGGEIGFWLQNRDEVLKGGEQLGDMGEKYLAILKQLSPNKRRIIDKMPDNYMIAPLLHWMFPNAKIVHVKRSPADTCFSIYTTINRLPIEWANDKGNIAFAYGEYQSVMEDWREQVPMTAMLDVRYEDIVSNPEQTTRQLVEFCGLEWNEACLQPERNRRTVATPSAWQVRQPFYKTSIDRWRRFEPWLGPIAELGTSIQANLPSVSDSSD